MATLTVYPDPHPETSTVDGLVGLSSNNKTWAQLITGAGNLAMMIVIA